MSRPRILVSIPYGMSARNLLRSETWDLLRRHAHILLLTPLVQDPGFRREFEGEGVLLRDYPPVPYVVAGLLHALVDAETLRWLHTKRIGSFEIKERAIREGVADDLIMKDAGIFSRRSRLLTATPGACAALRAALRTWVRNRSGLPVLLADWRPDIVYLTHPYTREERLLSLAAEQLGLRTVAMIHSWDNPTTKLKLLSRYHRVIVWNEIMRQQMTYLYDYAPEQVALSGMPQADVYARRDLVRDRAEFLRGLGLDPARRLIAFACGCPEFVPAQHLITQTLIRAIHEDRLAAPAGLVIRLHPGRQFPQLWEQASPPTVVIDEPTIAFDANRAGRGWRSDGADVEHFVNLFAHSDVFINAFSTTTIDASAMDRPVINIAYDADGSKNYYESLRKHYDWDHYRPIVASGGARIVHTPDQLVEAVNAYLRDPSLDREGRRRIVRDQCQWLDGGNGRRVAEIVLREAGVSL